jgi:hypothetical protein
MIELSKYLGQISVMLLILSPTILSSKLTPTTAEVSYYSDVSELVSANFEYYVKGNNVQYGTRFGVDLYKVSQSH